MNVKAAEKICEVLGKVIPTVDPMKQKGGIFSESVFQWMLLALYAGGDWYL